MMATETATSKKMAIIAASGSLDKAYQIFTLAAIGGTLDYQVKVFCTFSGLELLKDDLDPPFSLLADPVMLKKSRLPAFIAILPGVSYLVKRQMLRHFKQNGIADLAELRAQCVEAGVEFIACQMSVTAMRFEATPLMSGIARSGAPAFYEFAAQADINLHI